MSILAGLPERAAVAIVRLRSLGDCVLTTPAIHLLKCARPDLRVGVVVEDPFAPVFEGISDVDEILPPSVSRIRRFRPHLCLNLHGGTRSMTLTAASGARLRAGFAHFRTAAGLYNLRIPTAQEVLGIDRKVHTAEHLASAMFWLGVPVAPIPPARLFAERHSQTNPIAVIHPFASAPEKTWPAQNFLAVARHLHSRQDLEPVFIAGPGEDLTAFSQFQTLAGASMSSVKSLLSGASLFLGNDSGPAHLAAAFGVPAIVFFGPSDSIVWAPWKVESRVLSANPISQIPVSEAIEAAAGLCGRVSAKEQC